MLKLNNKYFYLLLFTICLAYSSCTLRPPIDGNCFGIINSALDIFDPNQPHKADTLIVPKDLAVSGNNMDIGAYLAWWHNPQSNLPVTEVMKHYNNGEFNRWTYRRFAQLYNDDHYWFYFILKNTCKEEQPLALAFLNKGYTVTLYKMDTTSSFVKIDSNTAHNPISKRPYNYQSLVFPVSVAPHETATYLVKVQKTTASNIWMPIWLLPMKALYQDMTYRASMYSFFGFFLFMIFLTLLLYAIFREKIYIYQCFYIITTCFFIFNWYNEDSNILPDLLYVPYSYLPPQLLPLFSTLFMLLIFNEFIGQKFISVKLHKLLHAMQWLNVLILGTAIINAILLYALPHVTFMPVNRWLQVLSMGFFTLFFPAFLVVVVKTYKKVNATLKIYLGFLVFIIVLWAIQLINLSGLTNLNLLMDNNLMLGLSIEIVVFTFITLYRFFEERAEKLQLLEDQLKLQQTINNSVIEAQESERKRIAAELHDGLGGFLTALRFMVNRKKNYFEEKTNAEAADVMLNVQEKLDTAIKDVRDISHNLMPGNFASQKFTAILKEHLSYLNEHGNIRFEYFIDEQANYIEQGIQISLYRIVSELIRNIQNHSGATVATIQVIAHAAYILLQVEDNGTGFKQVESKGIGLKNIQSRVDFHKGKMVIDSGKLHTTFTIEIPVVYERN